MTGRMMPTSVRLYLRLLDGRALALVQDRTAHLHAVMACLHDEHFLGLILPLPTQTGKIMCEHDLRLPAEGGG